MFRNWFALQFQKPTRYYRKAFFNFNAQERWTTDGLVLGNGLNHNLHVQLPSQWWVHFGVNANDLLPVVRRPRRARRARHSPLEEREHLGGLRERRPQAGDVRRLDRRLEGRRRTLVVGGRRART